MGFIIPRTKLVVLLSFYICISLVIELYTFIYQGGLGDKVQFPIMYYTTSEYSLSLE